MLAEMQRSRGNRYWYLLLILSIFDLQVYFCKASDSLSPGQSLTGTQTLTSKGDNFVLGFFSPGKSRNYYIGIWYKKVSTQTAVWVANRETPLPDTSAVLKFSEDGNLLLLDGPHNVIWSTNASSSVVTKPRVVLRDTGNLVLQEGSNSSVIIWQSFDHPTDTWLPGGRLGLNKVTGKNQILTSWRSLDDPAPGPFSLEIDPGNSTQYFILWNRTRVYWSSGNWTGKIFNRVPEMTSNYIYNFSFTDDAENKYFSYVLYDMSIISRFVMDVSGQIVQVTWLSTASAWNLFWSQPRDHCDVYSLCGAFGNCNQTEQSFCKCLPGFRPTSIKEWTSSDRSSGCIRNTPLQCENGSLAHGDKDEFLVMQKMQLPENPKTQRAGSREGCKLACLNTCSCTAYAYGTRGCLYWNGDLLNLRQLSEGDDLYVRVAASELQIPRGKKRSALGIAVGICVGVVVVIAVLLMFTWAWKRRSLGASEAVQGNLVAFSYRDLQVATKNFSERLGGGGFGSVYRGTILPDSDVVAVKKLEGLSQGEKQFRSEVSTIGNIHHVNLIRLRGFCSEGAKRLLVYDYMPNGSLDSHLFHNQSPEVLSWERRYQIVLGTARGLAYLHEKCRDCIIHCDIKPENVLLDDGFWPKVADFGLAKLMGREFSRVLTTMRGTRGYLAPEWISGVPITPKADVYSYGMMLFEVISGKRNVELSEDGRIGFFPTWAAKKLIEGEILSLLDPRLGVDVNIDELNRACKVACWCIQDDETARPFMGQVVQVFEGDLEVNMPPVPRTLQLFTEIIDGAEPFSNPSATDHSTWTQSNASSTSQDKSVSSKISK